MIVQKNGGVLKKFLSSLLIALCFGVAFTPAYAATVSCDNLFDVDNPLLTGINVGNVNSYSARIENNAVYNGGAIGLAGGTGITIPVSAGEYTFSFVLNGETANYEIRAVNLNEPNDNIFKTSTVIQQGQSLSLGNNSITFTMPTGYTHVCLLVYSATQYGSWETNVMLERGSTATSYVPYNPLCATCDGTVKQSPNLADVPDITDIGSYNVVSSVLAQTVAGLEVGKTYTLSADYMARFSSGARFIRFVDSSNNAVFDTAVMANQNGDRTRSSFTMTQAMKNIKNAWIYTGNGGTKWNDTGYLKNIQIEEGTTATPYHPYGTTYCEHLIKVATTAYNNNAFSSVQTALNNTIATIKTVVADTINQAAAVQQIASGKQTRPSSECPTGKTCLLIEDANGEPHWYEIITEYIPPEPEPAEE